MEYINLGVSTAGFFFSLLILWSGVGAGVLVIPALITFFNIDPVIAIASGSAFAFISKIGMTFGHASQGGIDWKAAKKFLLICLPITLMTAILMTFLFKHKPSAALELILITAILFAGAIALLTLLSNRVKTIISRWPMAFLSGATGALMGLTGVGGGVMVVPALVSSGQLPIKIAVATSIPIGLILSLAVSLTLGAGGFLDYALIASLLIGAVVGIPVGIRLFHIFSEVMIKRLICILVGIALFELVFKANELFQSI